MSQPPAKDLPVVPDVCYSHRGRSGPEGAAASQPCKVTVKTHIWVKLGRSPQLLFTLRYIAPKLIVLIDIVKTFIPLTGSLTKYQHNKAETRFPETKYLNI